MKRMFQLLILVTLAGTTWGQPQTFSPPTNKNAALRYWIAFAELRDRPADDATNKAMEEVLAGATSWDEPRLGSIVEENAPAILAMQRGSELPECNWGLEYSRGAAMSIAHLPKARVLARLNALYGARQMAQGDAAGAVTTWLSGLRFAQCMAKDMSLIGILSAKPAFLANLHLLAHAAQSGSLNFDLHQRISAQLRQLPPEGLDWPGAIRVEVWADEEALRYLARAPNFQEAYKAFYSSSPPQPAHPPTDAEIAAYRTLMNDVIAAFQLPDPQTAEKLKTIMSRTESMNPAVQSVIPNYTRMNDTRRQVVIEQEALVRALAGSK